jgi:hypothetical protein
MNTKKISAYLTPVLLAFLIFSSNFLSADLFNFGDNNFAVWFVLSLFCFACGWLIEKYFGWQFGGKLVFAVTIATSFFSLIFIIFFKEYFSADNPVAENLILFSLRNVMLGAMGFFGMSVAEVFIIQKAKVIAEEKLKLLEEHRIDAKKEAETLLREAQVKAKHIIQDAELNSKNIILKKERIEKELREFIQIEKELLKKYEE